MLPNIQAPASSQVMSTTAHNIPSSSLQVPIGYGIPSIPAKTRDKILLGEYIDFTELPPAKGKSLTPNALSTLESSVLLVNPIDLLQQRKVIPDLGVWVQCFAIYMAVICTRHPERLPDLLGYMCHICRASERYKWPSWIVFDQNFRQSVADQGLSSLSQIDATLFAQCFNGQGKENQSWCYHCHSLDHASDACPMKPNSAKTPKLAPPHKPGEPSSSKTPIICINYNSVRGCRFGKKCHRQHKCSECSGAHPLKSCPQAKQAQSQ